MQGTPNNLPIFRLLILETINIPMKKQVQYILLAVLALAVAGAATGYVMWNQPHRDLADSADFTVKPVELYQAFSADETSANDKYLNKVVEVSGVVMEKKNIEGNRAIVLLEVPNEMFGINCAFEAEDAAQLEGIASGTEVTLRGEVTGYTMDVNLARCILMN